MALRLSEPPPDVTATLRSVLLDRSRKRRFATPALAKAKAADVSLAAPHPVFVLGLDDLAAGRGLGAADRVAWRYLVLEKDLTVAAVEAPSRPGADVGRDLIVNEGPFVGATTDAIRLVEELPEVGERDFELRLLRIPALYVVALWLHGGDGDVVVPLAPAPPALEAGARYSGAVFTERLQDPAREQLEFDSTPREG